MIKRTHAVLALCCGISLACNADSGDYRTLYTSVSASSSTTPPTGLFYKTSTYIRPLEKVWMPAKTTVGAIEDQAHVVSYRTTNGKHTCELWWMGGDGGVPILSYLVDNTGAHYLPELSQPDADGVAPFKTVEEAKTTFARLAKNYYAMADAALVYFSSLKFSTFVSTSLPRGARVDARVGQAGRVGVPESVIEAFDFHYQVENADWGSVSLHKGFLGGCGVYAVYTTTDGDDAWLEVYSRSGTPLVSARLYAKQILGWDEVIGRTRMTTGFEPFWQYTMTEGYVEDETAAAAGQITSSWKPDVVLDRGLLKHASGHLTTVTLTNASKLSVAQKRLAYSAFEILWTRTLGMRPFTADPLVLGYPGHPVVYPGHQEGFLRLGTFVNPLNQKSYYVADWKDIDDASYTLYFERKDNYWDRKDDQYELAIQQYNN